MSRATVLQLVGAGILILLLGGYLADRYERTRPRDFTGTLRSRVFAPGGETTGIVLMTPGGTYELDLRDVPDWRSWAAEINGKVVSVRGVLRNAAGIEVKVRRIVRVEMVLKR